LIGRSGRNNIVMSTTGDVTIAARKDQENHQRFVTKKFHKKLF